MEKHSLAKRYAEALYSVTSDKENTIYFLEKLVELINRYEDFKMIMFHPYIEKERKIATIKNVFEGKIKKDQENFLKLILDYHRIEYIGNIYEEFKQIYNEFSEIQPVKIFVTKEIEDKLLEELKAVLSERLNRKIIPEIIIDKNLIGGIKITVGDKVYDGSIKRKLEHFREKILQEAM